MSDTAANQRAKHPLNKPIRVIGLMSGTSADGIDAALVRISGAPPAISAQFEAHHHARFPAYVRESILRLANGTTTTSAELSELNFLLGAEFARAAIAACKEWRLPLSRVGLIGSHGQTVFHLGRKSRYRGAMRLPSTLQIGDIGIIAGRTGIPTVGDFRPADMAAGGQGAPLVPFVDYLLYRDARRGRVALNIGGIANLTVIPAGAWPADVIAFDSKHYYVGKPALRGSHRFGANRHCLHGAFNCRCDSPICSAAR